MLLSYATQVYQRLLSGGPINRKHISAWHNFQISRPFLDLGFQIDVIPFDDHQFTPKVDYDVMVDIVSKIEDYLDRDRLVFEHQGEHELQRAAISSIYAYMGFRL
jgi:hypothetical protein